MPNYPKDLARLLKERSISFTERKILALELENEDALTRVTHTLYRTEINIHYVYAFMNQPNGKPVLAIAMEDEETAEESLKLHQIKVLSQEDLTR